VASATIATRAAGEADAEAVAQVYNEGIADRIATFETEPRSAQDRRAAIAAAAHDGYPFVVAETDGQVVGFASAGAYRSRPCYRGVGEFSVYVARSHRKHGVGRVLLAALIDESERLGLWKLVSRVFPENTASRALCRAMGFREVGVYEKHGKLDGVWKDCVIVERLIDANVD
jgi:L-amino acid N-acyltransferase YncA